jgi:hypothetical protein
MNSPVRKGTSVSASPNQKQEEAVEVLASTASSRLPAPPRSGNDVNELRKGTFVHRVTNLDLAICLLAVGVPMRKDPPYTHARLANGSESWVFNFESATRDGKDKTADLIEAYSQDMKFIEANPEHPFTFAMCALKNREMLLGHMRDHRPWVCFRPKGSTATMMVIEGSKKYQNCLRKKMIRIDPFEKQKGLL